MYKVIQETPISNRIVKELNAAVCTATFAERGIVKADLYHCVNSSDKLVASGSCAPIHGEYVKTVEIELS